MPSPSKSNAWIVSPGSNVAFEDTDRTEAMCHVLADGRRRHVLRYFQEIEAETATVDELVDYVAERDDTARDSLVTEFHHVLLPRLEESGAAEYDARSSAVRYRDHPALESLLRTIDEMAPADPRD